MNNAIQLEDRVSRSRSKHEGEPRRKYATGSAGLAQLVRGSSDGSLIMRLRPANISLINRRHYLPRLLLTLSSKRQMQKQKPPQRLADVDRVTPYHFQLELDLLGDGIVLEIKARVGKVRFWSSWQLLSVAGQRCIKVSGVSEPWRLRKLHFTYSFNKCYVPHAVAECKEPGRIWAAAHERRLC